MPLREKPENLINTYMYGMPVVLSFSPFLFQVYIAEAAIHIEHFTQMGNVMMWEHSDCRAFLIEELMYGAWKNVISPPTN